MSTVRFPKGYRAGEQIITPHGSITVGPERQTELTDKHADYFKEQYPGIFDGVDDDLTDEEKVAAAQETITYVPPAIAPNPVYENMASAREATGKFVTKALPVVLDAAHADALQSAELSDEGEATVTATFGGAPITAHAQSAALRAAATHRKKSKHPDVPTAEPEPVGRAADFDPNPTPAADLTDPDPAPAAL